MLFDVLHRGPRYPLGPLWAAVFPELQALVAQGAELPEGRYELAGGPDHGGVTATVSRYETRRGGRYESHRCMADIQVVLAGEEELHVLPLKGDGTLTEAAPYDAGADIVFYQESPDAAVRVRMQPGQFVLVLPDDAHLPGQVAQAPASVKKLVVKVPVAALTLS